MAEFGLNYKFLHLIDTTPDGASRTWVRVGVGVSSMVEGLNDNIDQTPYINGNGFGSSDKIGLQYIVSGTGHRVYGDTAQDYIASKKLLLGDDVKSNYKVIDQYGNIIQIPVTICNVVESGGDAQGKVELSFELHGNGEPADTPAVAAPSLTATVVAGTVAGTTKFTATPGGTDTLAYKLTAAALAPNENSYPGNLVAYTSGNNISASVGQYLNMFELDGYGRVVKFATVLLDSGDFPV
jgi:hypothetical protein